MSIRGRAGLCCRGTDLQAVVAGKTRAARRVIPDLPPLMRSPAMISPSRLLRMVPQKSRPGSRRAFLPDPVSPLEDRKVLSTVSAAAGSYTVYAFTQSFSNGDVDVK